MANQLDPHSRSNGNLFQNQQISISNSTDPDRNGAGLDENTSKDEVAEVFCGQFELVEGVLEILNEVRSYQMAYEPNNKQSMVLLLG